MPQDATKNTGLFLPYYRIQTRKTKYFQPCKKYQPATRNFVIFFYESDSKYIGKKLE